MSYDYNATYGPLRVYDQGADGDCVPFSRALHIAAQVRMHTATEPTWTGTPHYEWVGYRDGRYVGDEFRLSDGPHTIAADEDARAVVQERTVTDLEADGTVLLGITPRASLYVWGASRLPIIRPVAGEDTYRGHALLAVGHTPDGLIVQNSWGYGWGYKGRAVLTWEWLIAAGASYSREQVDNYGYNSAPRPPQPPTEGPRMLLARRTPTGPVYSFAGGARFWVKSRDILPAQGHSMDDVVTIPGSDPVWKAQLLGQVPPGGDL